MYVPCLLVVESMQGRPLWHICCWIYQYNWDNAGSGLFGYLDWLHDIQGSMGGRVCAQPPCCLDDMEQASATWEVHQLQLLLIGRMLAAWDPLLQQMAILQPDTPPPPVLMVLYDIGHANVVHD